MQLSVEVSDLASEQYDKFLAYIYFVLKNPQAADSLMQDFDDTMDILSEQAEHFEFCNRYLLVYRVKDNRVIVEGMYHELQDYENII